MAAVNRTTLTQEEWDVLDRRVINALARPVTEKELSVKRFFDAYACLLKDQPEWARIEKYIIDKGYKLTRGDLKTISKSCVDGEKTVDRERGWAWPSLFIITCLWGFSDNDRAGPVKLFYAIRSTASRDVIKCAAEMTRDGRLEEAFLKILALTFVGASYATKFLYAVATSKLDLSLFPVVFDSVVAKRLRAIGGEELGAKAVKAFAFDSSNRAAAAKGYVCYCGAVARWATALKLNDSAEVEMRLFTKPLK